MPTPSPVTRLRLLGRQITRTEQKLAKLRAERDQLSEALPSRRAPDWLTEVQRKAAAAGVANRTKPT
jgi:hypothetical protein